MRIAILSRGPRLYSTRRLREAAIERGHKAREDAAPATTATAVAKTTAEAKAAATMLASDEPSVVAPDQETGSEAK